MNKCIPTAAIAAILLAGCISTPQVESTKAWENHYYTVEQFNAGTKDIQLENGESIWVLSNATLIRLLKNTGK